jgi:hypothetical protein
MSKGGQIIGLPSERRVEAALIKQIKAASFHIANGPYTPLTTNGETQQQ